MRALQIITGHVIYDPAYTYKFQLKTTMDFPGPPVCGSDGISYPNPCSFKVAKCKGKPDLTVAYPGKCKIEG